MVTTPEPLSPLLRTRSLAGGVGWRVSEYLCTAGPGDRRLEECHAGVTVAAVVAGSFQYRTDSGSAILYPGAMLLGNAGACFECGHDHGVGDRCVAVQMTPECFEEMAASVIGGSGSCFSAAMLPASAKTLPALAGLQAAVLRGEALEAEGSVAHFVESVIAALSGVAPTAGAPSARDERRISAVLRYIEEAAEDALDLADLAGVAAMSRFHFLRCFRRLTGMAPYQYLLSVRLRRAAVRLATSAEPVSTIAFDVGFGDLSTFNARFRDVFGTSPSIWRRRHGRA